MAEFAIATGVLQVASAGISLTKALYDFGTTASAAGEQTDFIAKNISLYCRVLKTLGRQLKVDNPDHSAEALDVAQELQEQSNHLFEKIRELLPSAKGERDGLSFKQKLMWNFRKSHVDYLVGQLEYLKSTVTLLLHALSSVPKLRKYRRSKKKSPELRDEIDEELTEAQTLLYERCRAQHRLPELTVDNDIGVVPAIACDGENETLPPAPVTNLDLIPFSGHTLAEIDAHAAQLTGEDSRAVIMQNTASWLAQLYEQWTTLSQDDPGDDTETLGEEETAEVTVPEFLATDGVNMESESKKDISAEEKRARVEEAEMPLRDVKRGREDRRKSNRVHGEPAHSFPSGSKTPEDPFPQARINFVGGSKYDNCVARLRSSGVLKDLNTVNRKIADVYSLPATADRKRTLSQLEALKQELEQEHKTGELEPLRKAYLDGLEQRRESYNSLMRRLQIARGKTLFSENWAQLTAFNEVQDLRIKDHLEWLLLSRNEYKIWEEGDRIMIVPLTSCPDSLFPVDVLANNIYPTSFRPSQSSVQVKSRRVQQQSVDGAMKETAAPGPEPVRSASKEAKQQNFSSKPGAIPRIYEKQRSAGTLDPGPSRNPQSDAHRPGHPSTCSFCYNTGLRTALVRGAAYEVGCAYCEYGARFKKENVREIPVLLGASDQATSKLETASENSRKQRKSTVTKPDERHGSDRYDRISSHDERPSFEPRENEFFYEKKPRRGEENTEKKPNQEESSYRKKGKTREEPLVYGRKPGRSGPPSGYEPPSRYEPPSEYEVYETKVRPDGIEEHFIRRKQVEKRPSEADQVNQQVSKEEDFFYERGVSEFENTENRARVRRKPSYERDYYHINAGTINEDAPEEEFFYEKKVREAGDAEKRARARYQDEPDYRDSKTTSRRKRTVKPAREPYKPTKGSLLVEGLLGALFGNRSIDSEEE